MHIPLENRECYILDQSIEFSLMQQFKYVNVLHTFRIKIPPTSLLQGVAFKLVIGVDRMYVHFFYSSSSDLTSSVLALLVF